MTANSGCDEPISRGEYGACSENGPSRALVELLGKALVDQELRHRLFADPEATGRKFHVPLAEVDRIKKLDRDKFEHAAAQLRWG
jgi:hypothetical protein